ncbi:MAG: TRAP transporter small permease subunit [Rhodospirillales bacterium]|nr:TRAP transporter small permease subunit [Rhodospirillales bacterium]
MSGEVVRYGFVLPHWFFWGIMIVFPLVFLLLAQRRAAADAALKAKDQVILTEDIEAEAQKVDWLPPGNRFTRAVDALCMWVGQFASLWIIIGICYYVFEVLGRYFFNSPTNWVHEASFLMFGVMYTLGGAALYLIDGHVRVDVFYAKWSRRARAGADMVTTNIFFIFILGMLFSGWTFFSIGLDQNALPSWLSWIAQGYNMDLSQSEWQIAHWPVKAMIPFGAFLVALMGISRFVKDFQTFKHFSEVDNDK